MEEFNKEDCEGINSYTEVIPVFQFHIAFILKKYSFLAIGKRHEYTESIDNGALAKAFDQLEKVIQNNTKLALVLSGVFIEQLEKKKPVLVGVIKAGIKKERITLLGSTYHCSLASLYSPGLFKEQINIHEAIVKKTFDYTPEIFYNTAALYFDKLSSIYYDLNIKSAVAPTSEWHLNGRTSNQVFKGKEDINLILLADTDESPSEYKVGSLDESVLKLLSSIPAEKYYVPQPIYNKKLVTGKTLSSNALQNAVHQKIVYLKKRIKKQDRTELYPALSLFTALDFFDMLTKPDDQNDTGPYDEYTNLMNALTDFELVNKI